MSIAQKMAIAYEVLNGTAEQAKKIMNLLTEKGKAEVLSELSFMMGFVKGRYNNVLV